MSKLINLIVANEAFDRWECEWIMSLLSDFQVRKNLDPTHQLIADQAILVINLALEGKEKDVQRQLEAHRGRGKRIGLIHLSDEYGLSPVGFYDQADFVFRNYHRPALANRPNCHFFALGYKTGLTQHLRPTPISRRRYRWSFAGQIKTTRAAMLAAAESIPGGACFLTGQWEDPRALEIEQYADLLSDSVFALCPRGNRSLDSFRVYEALEAGAIPIVEDDRPSYWNAAYGEEFPCPTISAWSDLPTLLASIDVESTSANIGQWWKDYKISLRGRIKEVIETRLFNDNR